MSLTAERLVFAAPRPGEPVVVLADGFYDTEDEHVFWRGCEDDEVLRLPLTQPIASRAVHHFPHAPEQRLGEQALALAVKLISQATEDDVDDDVLDEVLLSALQQGEDRTASHLGALITDGGSAFGLT